ncbi:hypothetical protein H5410_033529 [Solanum commersonii]|uniref:Uncharacterized protein n=1 Tax=Solanum commersonii TaxID=4109 RepID=A0A9J5YQY7_SOLCO|nr:hypothetical protein H5410_033529 [Solanum commersonii]
MFSLEQQKPLSYLVQVTHTVKTTALPAMKLLLILCPSSQSNPVSIQGERLKTVKKKLLIKDSNNYTTTGYSGKREFHTSKTNRDILSQSLELQHMEINHLTLIVTRCTLLNYYSRRSSLCCACTKSAYSRYDARNRQDKSHKNL